MTLTAPVGTKVWSAVVISVVELFPKLKTHLVFTSIKLINWLGIRITRGTDEAGEDLLYNPVEKRKKGNDILEITQSCILAMPSFSGVTGVVHSPKTKTRLCFEAESLWSPLCVCLACDAPLGFK